MELTGSQRTKIAPRVFLDRGAKLFRKPRRLEPRQRQMRRERPLFPRNAKFFRGLFDFRRQDFQIRRSLNTRPENARMFLVREKTESTKIKWDGFIGARTGQSASNGGEFCFGHFTNEFQRHVKIFWTQPPRLRRDCA